MMMSSGWPAVTVRHEGGLHRQDLIELLLPDAGAAVHEAIVVSQSGSDRARENDERLLFGRGGAYCRFSYIRDGYDLLFAPSNEIRRNIANPFFPHNIRVYRGRKNKGTR